MKVYYPLEITPYINYLKEVLTLGEFCVTLNFILSDEAIPLYQFNPDLKSIQGKETLFKTIISYVIDDKESILDDCIEEYNRKVKDYSMIIDDSIYGEGTVPNPVLEETVNNIKHAIRYFYYEIINAFSHVFIDSNHIKKYITDEACQVKEIQFHYFAYNEKYHNHYELIFHHNVAFHAMYEKVGE